MTESQKLKELMNLQWAKTGVEYTSNLAGWNFRNGCLCPFRGTIRIPHGGYLRKRLARMRTATV